MFATRPSGEIAIANEAALSKLVAQAFSRRRKTLRNALKGTAGPEALEAAGIDPAARPETVPITAWVALANGLWDRMQDK